MGDPSEWPGALPAPRSSPRPCRPWRDPGGQSQHLRGQHLCKSTEYVDGKSQKSLCGAHPLPVKRLRGEAQFWGPQAGVGTTGLSPGCSGP